MAKFKKILPFLFLGMDKNSNFNAVGALMAYSKVNKEKDMLDKDAQKAIILSGLFTKPGQLLPTLETIENQINKRPPKEEKDTFKDEIDLTTSKNDDEIISQEIWGELENYIVGIYEKAIDDLNEILSKELTDRNKEFNPKEPLKDSERYKLVCIILNAIESTKNEQKEMIDKLNSLKFELNRISRVSKLI